MVSGSTIAVLHHVATDPNPTTIRDLINDTGYSQKQLYRAVDALTVTGDVTDARGVNRKELQPGNGRLMTAYKRLIATAGHVNWGDLLTPTVLRVAWLLDTPTRIRTIANRLDVTPQAVYSALDPLTGRAMLNPSGPEYALSDNLTPLHAVADAAAWHTHRVRVENLASRAVIDWYDPVHCLVRPQTPDDTTTVFDDADNWHVTGLAAFTDYDLQFFTHHEPLVWYSEHGPPEPEEITCHAILSDPGPRNVSYAMLLIETLDLDHDTVKQHAATYDLKPVVDAMLTALTQDDWTPQGKLPGPREYEQLKHQYGGLNQTDSTG